MLERLDYRILDILDNGHTSKKVKLQLVYNNKEIDLDIVVERDLPYKVELVDNIIKDGILGKYTYEDFIRILDFNFEEDELVSMYN